MDSFNYFQPTDIIFGKGRINELGKLAAGYGKVCLLVTTPIIPVLEPIFKKVKNILTNGGLRVIHFDRVAENPTTDIVTLGAKIARENDVDLVVGLGGGSSMDTAKAIAVEATHSGTAWDYLYFRQEQPTEKTLPIISISTTSGTGSQVTQVAVITNTLERNKSAIYNSIIYPKVAIVDPELMLTVPKHVTASTGWDAFCHAFESIIHNNTSPIVSTLAWEAINIVINILPQLLDDLQNLEARGRMALADTLAGLCIANAGVTLPHGIGMAISGLYPNVMHGESLAVVYPAFMRFTYKSAISQFARLCRIFNPSISSESDEFLASKAIEEVENFLLKIGMSFKLKDFNMPESEIKLLAKNSMILPDYKNNPKVTTDDEMLEIIKESYY